MRLFSKHIDVSDEDGNLKDSISERFFFGDNSIWFWKKHLFYIVRMSLTSYIYSIPGLYRFQRHKLRKQLRLNIKKPPRFYRKRNIIFKIETFSTSTRFQARALFPANSLLRRQLLLEISSSRQRVCFKKCARAGTRI